VDGRSELVTRKAEPFIVEALGDTRVVSVNGARQAGKSTLAKLAAATSPTH
jgi:predicted AAA+ superfamily ATPase